MDVQNLTIHYNILFHDYYLYYIPHSLPLFLDFISISSFGWLTYRVVCFMRQFRSIEYAFHVFFVIVQGMIVRHGGVQRLYSIRFDASLRK